MKYFEIPLKNRSKLYRFFEILPAALSYGSILTLIVLSLIDPLWASMYLLLVIVTLLVKATGIAAHTIRGRSRLENAQRINWSKRLMELENPETYYEKSKNVRRTQFGFMQHKENLRRLSLAVDGYPKPSELFNAVIVAAYNESFEVLEPTFRSIAESHYSNKQLIVVLAYEERGGSDMRATAHRLEEQYRDTFYAFHLVAHPADLPNEVIGKGGNITYGARYLRSWLDTEGISYDKVIATTLDSDNRPHPAYFDYLTYEYIVHDNRKHLSYQPVALFLNNIWDVPAPMRVVATGNSFWNIISSMRPHTLRNFASHSQPFDALVEMGYWSTRTIVEDGHQYWRSYIHFGGDYSVTPLYIPIYQDAVLSETYTKTLKAQFVQLRRWAYGASDVAYVASNIFTKDSNVPFFPALARLIRLIDGHVTLATVAILVSVGGWVPLLLNSEAARSVAAHQLPEVISILQRFAMIGLLITVFMAFKMLPPRPARYKRHRSVFMILQWALMPITAVVYSAMSAFYSQTRLALGLYLDKFDVTEKVTVASRDRAKKAKAVRDDASRS